MPATARAIRTAPTPAPAPRRHLELVHTSAVRPHGSRARYNLERCRCRHCRAANTADWRERRRRPGPALIPAAPVRDHLRWLQSRGVGYRQAAATAGVADSIVAALRSGRQRRVAVVTAERILDVGAQAPAPSALVDAAPSWALVDQLVAAGRTRTWIARQLGAQGRALRLGREHTTAARANAIEDLARREGLL